MKSITTFVSTVALTAAMAAQAMDWVVYEGGEGPGTGKHIVLLSGDEEYRSEEAMPMLGKILAVRHGFKCTVLFAVNPDTGEIDPNNQASVPGIEALDDADLCIMALRFREYPDDKMSHFANYYLAGKPFIALRTSTHAFAYSKNKDSKYAEYGWRNKKWPGGFGRQVLGETWVSHHGHHKVEATRGIVEPGMRHHPIVRDVEDIFGNSDVYTADPPAEVRVVVRGQVLSGMNPTDPPVEGKKNNPMQPVVWIRDHRNAAGKMNNIVTTTMGAATDLQSEGLRRMLVNSAYWLLKLPVPSKVDVSYVGEYEPTMYGFNGYKKGLKPSVYALED